MIAKLQRVPLRKVWKTEREFTAWVQDNIDVLNDVLDLQLANAEREQSAGAFSVDLVAEDEAGDPVVIENQLEKSDHDHLGKLITYLTAIGARNAIWIVSNPRPEHVSAITWLNESSSAAFFLVKVEAVQIEKSTSAPLLTLIVGPSDESREVGKKKTELAERHIIRKKFWTELLNKAKKKTKLHAGRSPTKESWISAGGGKTGLSFVYVIKRHEVGVEFYIDLGDSAKNEQFFDGIFIHHKEVEKSFGGPLMWQRLEGKRACRIKKVINIGGYQDETKWPEIQEAMINAMIHLANAVRPQISKI
jgi:hypothetical protein